MLLRNRLVHAAIILEVRLGEKVKFTWKNEDFL